MTKQPSYRFAGYTEPWKEKKLGEVADFTKGKGYSKGDLESSGVPIILYGRLYTNYQTIIDDVDTYVTMKEHSVLSEGNEIIVPSSGESSEEISRASVVAKKGVILGGDLNIIRLTEKFSSVFVAITLSNGSQQKELSKRAQGKSVVHLHNSDLKEVNLFYTSLPEQTAIGSFFQEIDQLISLQQRKLEVLKEQKKTYLNFLFPTIGQKKPALRFAGFEDEWKEVKLGEIIKSISSKNYITEYYKEGDNPVIQQGDIPIVGFSDNEPFNNFSNVILFGDHTLSLFKPETPFLLATDGIKILHSDLTTQSFLFIMLERYLPKSQGYKRHYSLLKNELSSLPSLPEQQVIGSFFQDLDKAIAKQEEKVNQLKESKQTLLRKMFI